MRVAVFGATSDIAAACLRLWATRGDQLLLFSRNEQQQAALAAELRQHPRCEVNEYTFDADNQESIKQAVAKLQQDQENGKTLDLLFVAFGYLGENQRALYNPEEASRITRVNYSATVELMTALLPLLEQQGRGQVAVLSSVAGERGRSGLTVYGASKAGVTAYFDGLRGWLFRHGVGVTVIKPGIIRTSMTAHLPASPLISSPEKIAPKIVRAIDRRQHQLYVPRFWWWIMLIVRHLPGSIMKRIQK